MMVLRRDSKVDTGAIVSARPEGPEPDAVACLLSSTAVDSAPSISIPSGLTNEMDVIAILSTSKREWEKIEGAKRKQLKGKVTEIGKGRDTNAAQIPNRSRKDKERFQSFGKKSRH